MMETSRYKGYRIVAHPYELHECRRWAADLEIRRAGRVKPVGVASDFASEAEAVTACAGLARRIIDGRVVGCSIDRLAGPWHKAWWLKRFRNGDLMRRMFPVGIVILAVGAWLLYRGVTFTSNRDVLEVGGIKVTAKERRSVPPWAGAAIIAVGAGLIIFGARKRA